MAEIPFALRAKLVGYGLLAGLAIGGAGTGYVAYLRWSDAQAHEVSMATVNADAMAIEARDGAAQARWMLDRAMEAVEKLNFGIANDRVVGAAKALESLDTTAFGADAGKIAEIKARLDAIRVDPTNATTVNADIAAAGNDLDKLLGR